MSKKKATLKSVQKSELEDYDIKEIETNAYNYAKSLSKGKLVELLKILSKNYYNKVELVSDEIYDIIENVLKEKDPNNKYLNKIGSKVLDKDIKLPKFMPSLAKYFPDIKNLDKWCKEHPGPYVIMDKIDGSSGLSEIDLSSDDIKTNLYTRGDGKNGKDISYLYENGFIENTIDKIKEIEELEGTKLYVRGELCISKENFKKYGKDYINERALTNGICTRKYTDAKTRKLIKKLDFLTYKLYDKNANCENQLKLLKKYGFTVVWYKIVDEISEKLLSKYLKKRRKESDVIIDGIVVMQNIVENKSLESKPTHGFAFKQTAESNKFEAKVLDVEWNPSKDGYLKPVVIIGMVKYSDNSEIEKITGYNAKFIVDNMIGVGAIVEITKSGETIPKILQIIKPAKVAKLPEGKYKWTESGVDMISIDDNDKSKIIIKKIITFFKEINAKNISEGIITKLYENGYTTVKKILSIEKSDIEDISGLGKKSSTNIVNNIAEALNTMTLTDFITATQCFDRGFGKKKIDTILLECPNVLFDDMSNEERLELVMEVDGFAEKTALQFVNNIKNFNKVIKELKDLIPLKRMIKNHKQQVNNKTSTLSNLNVVFTGLRPGKELELHIKLNGGKVSGSVSKNTTVVVVSDLDSTSAKITKARDLNIKIMLMDKFLSKYITNM